jgi:hypothetical protein
VPSAQWVCLGSTSTMEGQQFNGTGHVSKADFWQQVLEKGGPLELFSHVSASMYFETIASMYH